MEVHFTPEQEGRLRETAARTGLDPEALVTEAVDFFLASADHDIQDLQAAVAEGDADLEAGNYTDFSEETLHELFAGVRRRSAKPSPVQAKPRG